MREVSLLGISVLLFSLITSSMVQAGDQLKVIVPIGAGGALDRFARTVEEFLPNVLDVEVSVENLPKNGYTEFLNAPADGSNILAWFEPAAAAHDDEVNLDDLAIINVQEIEPPILVARPGTGWRNLDDMIHAIRRSPEKYRFGLGNSAGGGPLLTSALLDNLNLDVVRANYPSGGKARKAFAKGEVEFTAGSLNALRKLGDAVTPLAVFAPRRLRAWPEVPTIQEALGSEADHAVTGAVYRFIAVHRTFAEEQPEAYTRLVDAFRRMTLEDQSFLKNANTRGVGAQWFGPIQSTTLIRRSHQQFKKILADQRRKSQQP